MIEDSLAPVIRERCGEALDDEKVSLTAAVVVAAMRVTLELSTRPDAAEPGGDALGRALRYLCDGAGLCASGVAGSVVTLL